jgi:hypothetical protein
VGPSSFLGNGMHVPLGEDKNQKPFLKQIPVEFSHEPTRTSQSLSFPAVPQPINLPIKQLNIIIVNVITDSNYELVNVSHEWSPFPKPSQVVF